MNIMENLHKKISGVTTHAKKMFDTTKLDLKIKSYSKESEDIFKQIGKLVYDAKKNNKPIDTQTLNNMCSNIDKVRDKIKNLEKKIVVIKSQSKQQNECNNIMETKASNYATLNKKENDLKILRTEEGIKFLKFCSNCQTGNDPSAEACINCGHEFKHN